MSGDNAQIVLFPSFAYPVDDGRHWHVLITGTAYQPGELNLRKRMLVKFIGKAMQATPEELEDQIFRDRMEPFIATAESGQRIWVHLGPNLYRLKRRTRRSGLFRGKIKLSENDIGHLQEAGYLLNGQIKISASVNHPEQESASGIVSFLGNQGVSVISDIDDTIKVTGVGNRRELLANTFLREFRSISGMPTVYQDWQSKGAAFHYVSSSPWQLFGPLVRLNIDAGFPRGSIHLRTFRWRDQLVRRHAKSKRGKRLVIKSLIKCFPERQFILVGDSGERDPEIYRQICLKYPDRILGLFIRHVENNPLEEERFQKLKAAMPSGLCAAFSTAEELSSLAERLFNHPSQ